VDLDPVGRGQGLQPHGHAVASFAEGQIGGRGLRDRRHYSILMLAARTTVAQRAMSSSRNLAKSAPVPPTGVVPISARRWRGSGCGGPALVWAWSRATISGGVRVGRNRPYQPLAS